MQLRLDGGIWPQVLVVQVSSTGMLIEAPADPPLHVGHTAHIAFAGMEGVAVINAVYRSSTGPRAHYGVRIIEHDPGLVAAAARACAPDTNERVQIHRRSPGTPPASLADRDRDATLVSALRRALTLSPTSSLTLRAPTALLLVQRALGCDRTEAQQHLRRLVAQGDVIRIERAPDEVRYGLPVR